MIRYRSIAVIVALAALTVGCGNTTAQTVRPGASPATASTPLTQPSSPAPTQEVSASTKPTPPTPVSDGSAEAVFGEDLFADNTIADLTAKWVGVTFANPGVVTGDVRPVDAALSLPLMDEAATATKADPTAWTLVSFTDPAAGRVGTGATPLDPERMSVRWEAVKKDGINQLRVTFTAQVRTTYTQDGTPSTLDAERDFELWLVPSTDTQGDPWLINGFRNSEVRYPKTAGE